MPTQLATVTVSTTGPEDARRYRIEMRLKGHDYVIILDDYRTVSACLEDAARRIIGVLKP